MDEVFLGAMAELRRGAPPHVSNRTDPYPYGTDPFGSFNAPAAFILAYMRELTSRTDSEVRSVALYVPAGFGQAFGPKQGKPPMPVYEPGLIRALRWQDCQNLEAVLTGILVSALGVNRNQPCFCGDGRTLEESHLSRLVKAVVAYDLATRYLKRGDGRTPYLLNPLSSQPLSQQQGTLPLRPG